MQYLATRKLILSKDPFHLKCMKVMDPALEGGRTIDWASTCPTTCNHASCNDIYILQLLLVFIGSIDCASSVFDPWRDPSFC